MAYQIFTRTWWRPAGKGEPMIGEPGAKHIIHRRVETEEQARAICSRWFAEQYGGPPSDPRAQQRYERGLRRHLGRKAEFEEIGR